MNLRNRIRKIESLNNQQTTDWLISLSDEELERISGSEAEDKVFTDWLKTLNETELLTVRDGKPNAKALMEKFYEYKNENQSNRKGER